MSSQSKSNQNNLKTNDCLANMYTQKSAEKVKTYFESGLVAEEIKCSLTLNNAGNSSSQTEANMLVQGRQSEEESKK